MSRWKQASGALLAVVWGVWGGQGCAVVATVEVGHEQRLPVQTEFVRQGRLDGRTPVTERLLIPQEFAGLEVRLHTGEDVDADLHVYQTNPATRQVVPPLCVSESVGSNEVCVVKRPANGEVWVYIPSFEREKTVEYRLVGSFIRPDAFEALSAREIKPGSQPLSLGVDQQVYRLALLPHKTAVVVLRGGERGLTVEDDTGQQHPVHVTHSGARYVALGERTGNSQMILSGLSEARRYLIRVEPKQLDSLKGEPYTLTVLGEDAEAARGFLIPFSAAQVLPLPPTRGQGNAFKGSLADNQIVVYAVSAGFGSASIESTADLDLALCDEFGRVLEADDRTVRSTMRQRSSVSPERYLVILPNPFNQQQKGSPFQLRISAGKR